MPQNLISARELGLLPGPEPRGASARCLRTTVIMLGVLSTAATSHAGDSSREWQRSPEIEAWIERLTDQAGANCCSDADGTAPEVVVWDIGANHYRVKVGGRWIEVPDTAVVKGPNYLGHAVVWMEEAPRGDADADSYINKFPHIRCFLPGPAI